MWGIAVPLGIVEWQLGPESLRPLGMAGSCFTRATSHPGADDLAVPVGGGEVCLCALQPRAGRGQRWVPSTLPLDGQRQAEVAFVPNSPCPPSCILTCSPASPTRPPSPVWLLPHTMVVPRSLSPISLVPTGLRHLHSLSTLVPKDSCVI